MTPAIQRAPDTIIRRTYRCECLWTHAAKYAISIQFETPSTPRLDFSLRITALKLFLLYNCIIAKVRTGQFFIIIYYCPTIKICQVIVFDSGELVELLVGAELFEKRRKVADKWVVDGTNSNINDDNTNSISKTSLLILNRNLEVIERKVYEKTQSSGKNAALQPIQRQNNMDNDSSVLSPKPQVLSNLQLNKLPVNANAEVALKNNLAEEQNIDTNLSQVSA